MTWKIEHISAAAIACPPRKSWTQLSLPTKFCKVCGGHRLYRTLEDNGPPYNREDDYQCFDCDYQWGLNQYLRRMSMVLRPGTSPERIAYWRERYSKSYGIKPEDIDREPGPEHEPEPICGVYVLGEVATLGTFKQRGPLG